MSSPTAVRHPFHETDPTRWRLRVKEGRQAWEYVDAGSSRNADPQSVVDKYWLGKICRCGAALHAASL